MTYKQVATIMIQAVKDIVRQLEGIAGEDLTPAERRILHIASVALNHVGKGKI